MDVTDEMWQAVIANDASYDGRFFYAVKTTGVFCRPSCKSRPPRKENLCFFQTADQALAANFRPCKRCNSAGPRRPRDEWVDWITQFIDKHYAESLSLNRLAEIGHGSPYHLHRTFKRMKGVTPAEYIRHVRMEQAKERLLHSDDSVAAVGESVGLANTAYFITLFKKMTGTTPTEYRRHQIRKEYVEHERESEFAILLDDRDA